MALRVTIFVFTFIILGAGTIDLDNLIDYTGQEIPDYIQDDNTPLANPITNEGATLGRILFYDKRLSANGTISCASCHKQQFAFSDTAQLSVGLTGGLTGRHAMRLVNARFGGETRFFWDKRATSLENQATQPIKDHIEMGFSGTNGDLNFSDLIQRLESTAYYPRLFDLTFGDDEINEERIQLALAQFIRSIQSFDSRFDEGLAMTGSLMMSFPNFSDLENQGKALFLNPQNLGGAGCQGCHGAPEFDIDPLSANNGVIGVAGSATEVDITNTRSPTLRDLVNPAGQLNGPLMHNGNFTSLMQVINHYNNIRFNPAINPELDVRLRGPAGGPQTGQQLNLTQQEKNALVAFLRTLTGNDVYTNPIYSNPFDQNDSLILLPEITGNTELNNNHDLVIYPNPANDFITIKSEEDRMGILQVYNYTGNLEASLTFRTNTPLNISELTSGIYFLEFENENIKVRTVYRLLIN